MSHQAVIATKFPEQTIPKAYVDKILPTYKTCIGYAVPTEKGTIEVFQSNGTVEDYSGVAEVMKDNPRITTFYFGLNDADFHEDDLQPFIILKNDEGQPIMVAFLEGDFSNFHQAESARSDEFFAVDEHLRDKITELYHENGKDMDKLIEKLDGASFRRDLQQVIVSRGHIVLMTGSGKTIVFNKNNKQGMEFPWGEVSNCLDYTEEKVPEAGVDKPKLKLKTKAPPFSTPSVPSVEKQKDTETKHIPTEAKFYPPQNRSGKDLKKWYRTHYQGHFCPNDWEKRPGIPESKLAADSHLRVKKDLAALDTLKKTDTAIPASAGMTTEPVPLIGPEAKEAFKTNVLPNLNEFLSPEELKAQESRFQSMMDQTGWSLDQCLTQTLKGYQNFVNLTTTQKGGNNVIAGFIHSLRNLLYAKAPELFKSKDVEIKQPAAPEKVKMRMKM